MHLAELHGLHENFYNDKLTGMFVSCSICWLDRASAERRDSLVATESVGSRRDSKTDDVSTERCSLRSVVPSSCGRRRVSAASSFRRDFGLQKPCC